MVYGIHRYGQARVEKEDCSGTDLGTRLLGLAVGKLDMDERRE